MLSSHPCNRHVVTCLRQSRLLRATTCIGILAVTYWGRARRGAYSDLTPLPLQVYASYEHVRDVGSGATGAGLPARARPLTATEAEAGAVGGVPLTEPAMRQGLAWALAVRAVTSEQVVEAEARIKAATRATDLKEIHVALQVGGGGKGLEERSGVLCFYPSRS